MRRFSLALGMWEAQPFETVIADVAASGFTACELLQDRVDLESPEGLASARRVLESYGVQALTLHTAGDDISARDEDDRQAAVDRVSAAFEALGALGGIAAIVHPCRELASADDDPADRADAFRRSLGVLGERARAAGIRVACENLPERSLGRPLGRMEDLRAVVDEFPDDIGLCLDAGHAVRNGLSPVDEARIASDRLIALHLHDADAESDHWIPGDRSIDWSALNAALTGRGFEGPWTFEVTRAGWQEGLLPAARRARQVADGWDAGRF